MLLFILLQADSATNNLAEIITAVGVVIGVLMTGITGLLTAIGNRRISEGNKLNSQVAIKVDGLLEQKTLADKALGRIEGIDTAAKEKAIGDARELQSMKEQQLLNQTPPNRETKSDVKDVKGEIIKAVETKADETQEVVKKIPEEVVKKLPPT